MFIYANGEDLWLEEVAFGDPLFRFFPVLAGISTLFLAYIFAKREFGIQFACIFLFLLVSSDPLLFYSVNLSFYGIEALLIVLSLCIWSFSSKKSWTLILLVTLASIFCMVCNYDSNETSHLFKNFYIQMLGRHFINFHYFVFGPFVWINAAIFILPFCLGSIFLYRKKRALLIAILAVVSILILFYILKITPLGMPYSNFMRVMHNWSQMQVVGSKYLVFILPLVFIPVAFFINKFLLRVGTGTLIGSLLVFALLATSSNLTRMHKGIGSPESTVILKQINENANAKSLIYVDSVSRPIFEHYIRKSPFKDNPNLNYFYIKTDGYMYLNDSIFIGKPSGKPEELFSIMESFGAENGFFFSTFSSFYSVRESNKIIASIQKNYKGKSKGFQARQAGAAWIRFL